MMIAELSTIGNIVACCMTPTTEDAGKRSSNGIEIMIFSLIKTGAVVMGHLSSLAIHLKEGSLLKRLISSLPKSLEGKDQSRVKRGGGSMKVAQDEEESG